MRVFKPTYSKPLPEGARISTCKRGQDRGKQFAKFKDAKGHTTQAPLTKAGDKILVEVKHWHIQFEDHHGIRRQLKAYTDERATERLAKKIEDLLDCQRNNRPPDESLCVWLEKLSSAVRNELIGFGLVDAQRADIGRPLAEHVEEFKEHLEKKERNSDYIKELGGTLNRVFGDCGFETWTDISAARLKDYLDGLRDNGNGISKRRYNGLLGMTKFFCRWMVKQQKAASSPIEYLDGLDNQQTDQRHPRRVLDLNDFRRFLEAARTGPKVYGLMGYERNLLYRFAAETGLRSVDIRRLEVKDFSFAERKLTVQAGRTKNKASATVYLKPATAAEIKQYCTNKTPKAKVFYVTDKTADMVRFDLANTVVRDASGKEIVPAIPYVDENGEYFDFHSIRHMCASLLGMNPDTPEAVRQQAMRHKSPEMTRHYTHSFEQQHREAIEGLPDLTQPSRESQATARTGTDDRNVTGEILSKSCFEHTGISEICAPVESSVRDCDSETLSRTNNEGTEGFRKPMLYPTELRALHFLI
jgi:integrase